MQKTDYTSEALDRLLSTLKGDPKTDALISSFVDRCQELEDAAYPMVEQRNLDVAEGTMLDRIGSIVNLPRGGRDDDDYRLRIRAEIAILNSDGLASDMIQVLQLLVGEEAGDIELDEGFPKALTMRARNHDHDSSDLAMDLILSILVRAASAGTEVDLVYSNEASDDNVFHFSNTADTVEAGATYGTENGSLAGGAL